MNGYTLYRAIMRVSAIGCIFFYLVSCCTIFTTLKTTTEPVQEFEYKAFYPQLSEIEDISLIEGNANIIIPPSSQDIYVYTTGLREIDTQVRFSMKSSELSEFISSTLCTEPLEEFLPTPPTQEGRSFPWWIPDQALSSEKCYGENDYDHQLVIIDKSDAEIFIVYVSTSTY
jgi:hypothetical protein